MDLRMDFVLFFVLLFFCFDKFKCTTTEIVLQIANGSTNSINFIELEYNLKFMKHIFDEYYLFKSEKLRILHRQKRDMNRRQSAASSIKLIRIQKNLKRQRRHSFTHEFDYFTNVLDIEFDKIENTLFHNNKQVTVKRPKTGKRKVLCGESKYKFNDPFWSNQWYINDGCVQGKSMNISGAWDQGVTGKNIVLTIIDDGVESSNPDLKQNYDSNASTDLNDNDTDPQPRYEKTNENKHGTRCAGEISASANNSLCGIGVAYNSRIGGIRLLDGKVNDRLEAEALTFNLNYIDIYSASWGPLDNGKTVEGPDLLAGKALIKGVTEGRQGKGTIYVWASGNGGHFSDNCNCDGYAASIYTITISSVSRSNRVPKYSERCASILAATYSSSEASNNNNIITTDLHNGCTSAHSGTSASAPIGAAIIALTLEANKNLTWRDIQHLIVRTSDNTKLFTNDWVVNGAGRIVSHTFGYGLMNAGRMVELARNWKPIRKQMQCEVKIFNNVKFILPENFSEISKVNILRTSCAVEINSLEHVVSKVTLKSGIRGALSINLLSPSGTKSNLLAHRYLDKSQRGFKNWPFMSVHFWGENPYGVWTLEVGNTGKISAYLQEWSLVFYGTTDS